ncbi:hypothetical protein FoTM2_005313 [Fusarium oxysporum f. sp. vasinfectum]|nr:hypothetical protein FoTM2_005313 [Fusarium oxysporum f. sp. vasinfectum]
MPPIHRPFYDYWRQVETDATVKVKHHSSILWPFINKDSLGKPTPLLLLLNSRGRHPPPFFIDTDSQYVQRAALADMLVDGPLFPTRGMQLILRSVSSGDVHGTLREVPKFARGTWLHLSTKDYDWPTSDIYGKKWLQNQFSTSFGMVILEIQERSMDFLVKCCHQILRHIEPDNLFNPGDTNVPARDNCRTPYRVPTRLDFANLEKLFAAKVAAAEDHVWAMREDPN